MTILTRITAGLLATTCLAGAAAAQTDLSLWYHGAGNEVERNILAGIVDDFNASQTDWKVVDRAVPAGRLQRLGDRGGAVGRAAGHSRRRRADHAELGLGRLSRAADHRPGQARRLPARRDRQVERQGLLGRLLGRGARGLRAQVGARGERHPHPDAGQALDRRGVQRDPRQAQGDRQVRVSAQHRHGRQGRVVSLRLPALPLEHRRRPRRPLDLPDRRRRAERRRRRSSGASGSRASSRTGMVPGTVAEPRRPPERLRRRQVRAELDRQLAGALQPREVRRRPPVPAGARLRQRAEDRRGARGSSRSPPRASTRTAPTPSSSSRCRTSTSPPSPTASG